ncbi:hypothetical protein EON65_45945, partial [archaeon]
KMHLLQHEYSPNTLGLMRAIKTTLDPSNLLNPGKVVDVQSEGGSGSACVTTDAGEKKGRAMCNGDQCSRKQT